MPRRRDLGRAESIHGERVSRFERRMHMSQEEAVRTTRGTKIGATSVSLTELPSGFPGRIFRSPMPFGPYDLHMPGDETTHSAGATQRVGAARLLTN